MISPDFYTRILYRADSLKVGPLIRPGGNSAKLLIFRLISNSSGGPWSISIASERNAAAHLIAINLTGEAHCEVIAVVADRVTKCYFATLYRSLNWHIAARTLGCPGDFVTFDLENQLKGPIAARRFEGSVPLAGDRL